MYSKMYVVDLPFETAVFRVGKNPLSFCVAFATGDGLERTGGLSAIVQHET